MKNSRRCPKCQSNDILRVEGESGAYGSGNNIRVGMTILSSILVTRFVCCSCGFSEEWIENAGDIEKLKNKFGRK